jgi:hypothetical protein
MLPNKSQTVAESFALCLAIARIERFVAPAPAANTNLKIIHAPVKDALLEASAERATNLLASTLAYLENRNAIITRVVHIERSE